MLIAGKQEASRYWRGYDSSYKTKKATYQKPASLLCALRLPGPMVGPVPQRMHMLNAFCYHQPKQRVMVVWNARRVREYASFVAALLVAAGRG